ncbi:protein MGARP [Lissotriton helveticus]
MSALCRTACLRLLPLARAPLPRTALVRHMSASNAPGSSGSGMIYYIFVGVATAGGGFYLYRTLTSDKTRFHERAAQLENKAKTAISKCEEDAGFMETPEVSEEIEEVTTVEAVAIVTEEVQSKDESYKEANYTDEAKAPVEGIPLTADDAVAPREENATLEEVHEQETKVEVAKGEMFTAPVDAPHSSEEIANSEEVSAVSFQNPDAASEQEMPADNEAASTVEQTSHSAEEHVKQAEDLSELSLQKPEMNSEEAV